MVTFESHIAPITAFKVEEPGEKDRQAIISVDGRKFTTTPRFWTSLCAQYSSWGLNTKLFRLFDHDEVFERLTDTLAAAGKRYKTELRYTIEQSRGREYLLAVVNPTRPLITRDQFNEIAITHNGQNTKYDNGVVSTWFRPQHMEDFKIGPDNFEHNFVMETPIDGFGDPLIYLSLIRTVCTNGSVGYGRAFRSEIRMGKSDPIHTLHRVLESFNNEEGYNALRARFNSATESWASINESSEIYKTLVKIISRKFLREDVTVNGTIERLATERSAALGKEEDLSAMAIRIMRAYSQLTGDLCSIYGIANTDELSRKKMAQLPVKCSVYDLINFATEVATHYCTNGRLLHAAIGDIICHEYDLEGTKQTHPSFRDFFLQTSA